MLKSWSLTLGMSLISIPENEGWKKKLWTLRLTYVNSGESSTGKRMFGVIPRNRDIRSFADIVIKELCLRLS